MRKPSKNDYIKIVFLIIILITLIIFLPRILSIYDDSEALIINSGILAPLVFMSLMIIAILVSPIPATPLTIISGMVFGPWKGMLYTLIGATIGAVLAFLIARFFLRDYFQRNFANNKTYREIMGKKGEKVAFYIFITRLMPQISFDLISYLAGLTKINIFKFTVATFFGMIPFVFLVSFFGYLIEPYKNIMLLFFFAIFILYLVYKILKVRR